MNSGKRPKLRTDNKQKQTSESCDLVECSAEGFDAGVTTPMPKTMLDTPAVETTHCSQRKWNLAKSGQFLRISAQSCFALKWPFRSQLQDHLFKKYNHVIGCGVMLVVERGEGDPTTPSTGLEPHREWFVEQDP